MKQNSEYTKNLLITLQKCPSPWPTTSFLKSSGLEPDEQMLFHLQLLNDNEFIEPVGCNSDFGFDTDLEGDEEVSWMHAKLRLTAKGHEFIEALDKKEIWDVIKGQFHEASLRTIFKISQSMVDGYARETIKKYVGDVKI